MEYEYGEKIIIATHELVYGVPQALKDYLLKKKCKQLLFIVLPFIVTEKSSCTLYKEGLKVNEKTFRRKKRVGILDFFIDFFQIIWWVYKNGEKYDVFIGVNNLNSLAGLFLKKIGRVEKVVFYTMDFVPIRFENKILNYVYHKIEKICVKRCDETWNVSPRMAGGREEYLGLSKNKYPQRVVPVGTWNDNIKKRSFKEIKKNQILFIGHLLEKQGIQIILESLPQVIKKIGDVRFLIVGGGDYENAIKKTVEKLKLEKNVIFTGWILDRKKIDEMLSENMIAVATYKPEKKPLHNFTYFADPYKIKDYLGAGLPIVMTDISYNVKEIADAGCGVIVKYDKDDIAKAIIKLLKDEERYKKYRQNALNFAKQYDWTAIYDKVFNQKQEVIA